MSTRGSPQREHVNKKSTFKFLCPCFGLKNTQDLPDERYILIDDKDRYEYVVEKLAIKKIPLSIFGTEEDYKRNEKESSTCSFAPKERRHELFPNRNVNYQSYYMKASKHQSSPPRIESSSSSSPPASEHSGHSAQCPHYRLKQFRQKKQENEVVSNILNKYSSLYTLDDKDTVPKDPLTFPKNNSRSRSHSPTCPTVMTPKLEVPRMPVKPHKTHQQIERHMVEIHETPQKECSRHEPSPLATPGMTKSMRRTINALGSAQPYTKIMLARNCRGSSPPVRDDPMQNVKKFQSEELECVSLDNDAKISVNRCERNRDKRPSRKQTKYQQIFTKTSKQGSCKSERSSNTNQYVYLTSTSYQSLPKVLEEENKVTKLPSKFSVRDRFYNQTNSEQSYTTFNKDAAAKYNSEEPIMEINHMKGKNLKWKIIIKHHDDDRK